MHAAETNPTAFPTASLADACRQLALAAEALSRAASGVRPHTSSNLSGMASATGESLTLTELANEFLRAKARAGRSAAYLKRLRCSLQSFRKGRASAPVDRVTTRDLEDWVRGGDWSVRTRRNLVADCGIMFSWAIKRGYLARNPAAAVEIGRGAPAAPVVVHSPEQVKSVLEAARRENLDVLRHLAVRYFAGLRTSEALALREENLKLDQGLIEVPAAKAKTRRRRLVTIQPNLKAWLALGGELRGISPMTIRQLIRRSGQAWPSNVARHSFISYHLAHFHSAGMTALEGGHSEQVLFAHYRAVETPAAAKEFWSIVPS